MTIFTLNRAHSSPNRYQALARLTHLQALDRLTHNQVLAKPTHIQALPGLAHNSALPSLTRIQALTGLTRYQALPSLTTYALWRSVKALYRSVGQSIHLGYLPDHVIINNLFTPKQLISLFVGFQKSTILPICRLKRVKITNLSVIQDIKILANLSAFSNPKIAYLSAFLKSKTCRFVGIQNTKN